MLPSKKRVKPIRHFRLVRLSVFISAAYAFDQIVTSDLLRHDILEFIKLLNVALSS